MKRFNLANVLTRINNAPTAEEWYRTHGTEPYKILLVPDDYTTLNRIIEDNIPTYISSIYLFAYMDWTMLGIHYQWHIQFDNCDQEKP